MIDWAECLKFYSKYIKWHLNIADKYWCDWYQEQCRYYEKEL